MVNKQMCIDFINYGIIGAFFLVVPYSISTFLIIILSLIGDFINLYFIERKEKMVSFDLDNDFFNDRKEG